MRSIEIGDYVRLKDSVNSAAMVVEGFTKNGYVTVWWWSSEDYNGYKKKEFRNYLPSSLEHFPDLNTKYTGEITDLPSEDLVQHPPHYTKWPIQPRDFCMKNNLPFWMGSVLKYILRAGEKQYDGLTAQESEILDLEKAREFIEHRIRMIKNG